IINTSSRYGSVDLQNLRMMGLNNIELISDRPIEDNLREIAEVKRRYPRHAVIASLMLESKREVWHDIVKRAEDAGADGLELNFGCPHGMSERGVGAREGGADGISLINTINSIVGIDLETLEPRPMVDGRSSHGGYCGPAVK